MYKCAVMQGRMHLLLLPMENVVQAIIAGAMLCAEIRRHIRDF
jgi:hypothetical protein